MSTLHECPCGCGERIARNLLACRTGWFALPRPIAVQLTGALRRKDWRAHREHLAAALAWYRSNAAVLAEKRERNRDRT